MRESRSAPTGSLSLPPPCERLVPLPFDARQRFIWGRESGKPKAPRNSRDRAVSDWPRSLASIHACISGSQLHLTGRTARDGRSRPSFARPILWAFWKMERSVRLSPKRSSKSRASARMCSCP